MKKFIAKSLLFSLGLGLVFCIILFVLSILHTPKLKANFEWAKSSESNKEQCLIIGNSVGLYGRIDQKLLAKNLCIRATGPITGFYLLKEILCKKTNDNIKAVFLAYAPEYINSITSKTLIRFIPYFSKERLKKIMILRDKLGDKNFVFPEFILDPKTIPINLWSSLVLLGEFSATDIFYIAYKIKLYFGLKIRGHKRLIIDKDKRKLPWTSPPPPYTWSQVNTHYLSEIKKLCQKHNIRLVYLHMPLNETAKYPKQKWFDDYYQILDSIGFEQIPPKINFLHRTLFRDKYGHLNSNGRDVFHEKYLAPALKKAGVELAPDTL